MKLEDFAKEINKSVKLSPKSEVFVVHKDQAVAKIMKIRTKGDCTLIYIEGDK